MGKIDFDELAENLGGFGRYQVLIFSLACLFSLICGLGNVTTVFTAYIPDHRCFIQKCDTAESSSFTNDFINFTIPTLDEGGRYEHCSSYEFVGDSRNDSIQCSAQYFNTSDVSACSKWVYNRDLFTSTLVTEFDLVCENGFLVPLAGSCYMAGMLLGAILTGIISDKFGRRMGLLLSLLAYGLGGVGAAAANTYTLFLCLRFFSGMGTIGIFQSVFVIVVELIGSDWRTFCSMFLQAPNAMGEVVTGIMAYFIREWRWLQAASAAPALIFIGFCWVIPESIRWLESKNKINEIMNVVDRTTKFNNIPSASDRIKKMIESDELEKHLENSKKPLEEKSVFNLLKLPNMRKKTLILLYCWIVCSLAYYGLGLQAGNLPGDIFVSYILTMIVEIPSAFVTYFLLIKAGRKGTMMMIFILGGVACIISGLLPPEMKWLIITFSLIGKFGISGAFTGIYIYTAELYPTEYRGIGVGACSMASRIGGISAPVIASLAVVYQPLPLLIFGVFSLLAGVAIIVLPETLGSELPQTLEESEEFGKDQGLWTFSFCGTKKDVSVEES